MSEQGFRAIYSEFLSLHEDVKQKKKKNVLKKKAK